MMRLVGLYRRRVFGLCYRILGHHHDAEDVTQETFLRALRGLGGFDPRRRFEPWLLAIAGNRCRTLIAQRRRRPATAWPAAEMADRGATTGDAGHLAHEVRVALHAMRDQWREAFLLFHEGGLSYQEIAQVMDCPPGTAKTWVHRARRELMTRLIDQGVVEEAGGALRAV